MAEETQPEVQEEPKVEEEQVQEDQAPTEETPEPTEEPVEQEEEKEEAADDTESEDEESEEEDTEAESYEEYTDPALKQAVEVLKELEIPVEEANKIFAEAVETGDLTKIDRDALVEKCGKDKADLVLVLAESYYNKTFARFQEIEKEAHKLTDGKENFDAMRKWAQEKEANDAEFAQDLAAFRKIFDSENPRAIKMAVTELYSMYTADPDTTVTANLETGDRAAGGESIEPLSRREYGDLVQRAHRNGTYEQDKALLWKRREAGMKQGM